MFRLLLAFVLLFSTVQLAPVAFAQDTSQPSGTIETETEGHGDAAIRDRLRNIFGELEAFKNIFVTVNSGVVTLKGRVLETSEVTRAAELAARVNGVVSVNNLIGVETSVEKRIAPALERFTARLSQVVSLLPLIALALLVFAIITFIGLFVAKRKYPWDVLTPNRFVADLLRQIVRLVFIGVGLIIALDIMGATALLGTIVGAAGIFGLAIGFAVRDTVENYIASILLSFRQPFRPKDYVDVEGREGSVIALTSRATILMTADGNHVRIPNATVFKSTITNYSLNPERRFDFVVGIETDDLQAAVDMGLSEIKKLSFVLDEPAPDGWVNKIGDSTVEIWFGAWINQSNTNLLKARAEAIRKVLLAFQAAEIGVPEPIYRVRFDDAMPTGKASGKKAPKKPKAAIVDTGERDVSPDTVIEKKIDEQLAKASDKDLLDSDAEQEVD